MCNKCKGIMLRNSIADVWEEALKEWDFEPLTNIFTMQCMCGKYSQDVVQFTNRLNGNTQIMGRICVKGKFLDEQTEYDILHIYCPECDEQLKYDYVDKHELTEKHLKNYIEFHARKCIDCGVKCEDEAFEKCFSCQHNDEYKKCTRCNIHEIIRTDSRDICSSCIFHEYHTACDACKKTVLIEETTATEIGPYTCRECTMAIEREDQLAKVNRRCTFCNKFNIPKYKDEKYKLCFECFKHCVLKESKCPKCNAKITAKQLETYKKCFECCQKARLRYG